MMLGGERADALAERFGTPVLVIDLRTLDGALDAMLAAAAPHNIAVSYAGKALLLPGLVQHLHPRPIGIDVSSIGEIAVAERGGFEASRLTLHGAGKTAEEHDAALDGRVGRIVVDGMDELHRARWHASAVAGLMCCCALIPGSKRTPTILFARRADRSKFGFAPSEADEAFALLRNYPSLRVRGVHAHIGSQTYDTMPYVENAHAA